MMSYIGEKTIKDILMFYQNKIQIVNIYAKPTKVICVEIKIPIKKKWLFLNEYKKYDLEFHYNLCAETLDTKNVEMVIFFDFDNHTNYFETNILNNTKNLIDTIIFKAEKIIKKYDSITIQMEY